MPHDYDFRRIVSYVAFHCRMGRTLPDILALAARRRPPFTESEIRQAWPHARHACRNARLIGNASPFDRICDVRGVKLPSRGDDNGTGDD